MKLAVAMCDPRPGRFGPNLALPKIVPSLSRATIVSSRRALQPELGDGSIVQIVGIGVGFPCRNNCPEEWRNLDDIRVDRVANRNDLVSAMIRVQSPEC